MTSPPPVRPPQLPAHPPSPRQQRTQKKVNPARVSRVRRPQRGNYLGRHWRGDVPLAMAVIVSSALLLGSVQLLNLISRYLPIIDYPYAASIVWALQVVLLICGVVWWGVGVQRAAIRSVDQGGSMMVALLTGAVGLGAFFWVGAFWLQSARYVLPEVWATLSGSTVPAVLQVNLRAASIALHGELEFGSTRALRAALDANPGVRSVQLESRGGRVAEGVAMGSLIRDRKLDTVVIGECSSACVTAFAGGNQRLIGDGAHIGLHSAGGQGFSADAIALANRRSDEFIASRGVDWAVLEKGAAISNDQIWFPEPGLLIEAGLATDYVQDSPSTRSPKNSRSH